MSKQKIGTHVALSAIATAALFVAAQSKAATLDGTLTPGEGYGLAPLATQVNVTNSLNVDGGGDGGSASESTPGHVSDTVTQLSNVYAYVDNSSGAPVLDMFIGGSFIGLGGDTRNNNTDYMIALQTTKTGGPNSLTGQNLSGLNSSGNLTDVQFQFNPNILISVDPFAGGTNDTGVTGNGNVHVKDLTTPSAAPVNVGTGNSGNNPNTGVGVALNNALARTVVAQSAMGAVSTGLELTIPLTTLLSSDLTTSLNTGYTGGPINAFIFPSIGGGNRTDNQILAPFDYGSDSNGYDYSYMGTTNGPGDVNTNGRQFIAGVYPADATSANPGANAYFTISVPEPTSLSFLALGGLALLGRRKRSI
jgi:hypothetical protein